MRCVDRGDHQPLVVEHRRAGGNADAADAGQVKGDAGIAARLQRVRAIAGDKLYLHRARRADDRVGGALHPGGEGPPRIFGHRQRGVQPRAHRRRIALRDGDIDAHPLRIDHGEQRLRLHRAGADQIADIGGTLGDRAGEGRADRREPLLRRQPAQFGGGRLDRRLLDREVAGLFRRLLLRHRIRCQQVAPARGGVARQPHRRARAGKVGAGAGDRLVEFGGVDHPQRRAGGHLRADIAIPGADIAGHAGIEVRGFPRRRIAGQGELGARRRLLDRDQPDGGDRFVLREAARDIAVVGARHHADGDAPGRDQRGGDAGGLQSARARAPSTGGRSSCMNRVS